MKIYFSLIFLLFVSSCSTTRIDRKISDSKFDLFSEESFLRWDHKRLTKLKNFSYVSDCYSGEVVDSLDKIKANYAQLDQQPFYWLNLGNCYFMSDSWNKAEFYFRLGMENTQDTNLKSIFLNNLALVQFQFHQWEKGKDLLLQSSSLNKSAKVPRFNLSQIYIQFGLYDKAIEILKSKDFLMKSDIDVNLSLAVSYLFKKDFITSSKFFSSIPKEMFSREDVAISYALYLIETGKLAEAKNLMKNRDRSNVLPITKISYKIEKILLQRLKEDVL